MRTAIVAVLVLTACSDPAAPAPTTPAPPPAPTTPATTTPTPPSAPLPSTLTTAPPAGADAPAPESPAPAPLPILAGDVVWIDGTDDDERRTLLIRIADEPQPHVPVLGTVEIHQGVMELRVIAELPGRYATAAIADSASVCTARVLRTRKLHGRSEYLDDETVNDATYLALDFEDCPNGSAGVVGTAISVRSLRELGEPAPADVAALVQPHDDDLFEPPPLESYRLLALPERDLRIVRGNGAFVLGHGVRGVGTGSLNGMLDVLIEAGYRTFFVVESPSESWLEPLERVMPEIRRSRCVVIDESGTPLNVRRLPRASAEVLTTLQPGTEIEALEGPSAWAHVATTPHGWAHDSGLRCTPLPSDPAL